MSVWFALLLLAQSEKVEEVDFGDLDKDDTKVEVVTPDQLAHEGETPEYDRRPWLRVLPLFALLIVMWNVDWRELRVKAEIAARRARKPSKKDP